MPHKIKDYVGEHDWHNRGNVPAENFKCGYCSSDVGSDVGWQTQGDPRAMVRLCPMCNAPTFFDVKEGQWPGAKAGQRVSSLPSDVQSIHEEARSCIAANAPSGAAMLCRKILMHVAVEKGAKENQSFKHYIKWLIDERWAPKGAEDWLDYIRSQANDATHEIMVMEKKDAVAVLL